MSTRRIVASVLALAMVASGPGFVWAADAPPVPAPPPVPAAPPAPGGAEVPAQSPEATPARVSYVNGEVSFWRPGAQDWAPAKFNTPLAPGDVLYAGQDGNVELQIGPRAFVRAGYGAQIGLDNQEPDFVQLRVTAGEAAVDLRELAAGQTVEVDTPNAAFTIERAGYYHLDVAQDSTTFAAHRGGSATVTPAGGAAASVAANQQVVVTGTDSPRVDAGAAPALTAWDRWNYQRTDYLIRPASARYVAPAVYGTEALDQYGSWRTVQTYGSVWVPAGVPAGWVPYSTGRWIWDPRFGWTWLDDAPWGWAPYHYGRWVFVGSYWAWAPGPIVVRPAYSPALVVFLGGGLSVSIGRPLCWAPLGWGEPVIPWWGRPGFIGRPWWGGWGGPRVVNNVVVTRTTIINVTNINVYKNVNVVNGVVGVPAEHFGQHQARPVHLSEADVRQLSPVRGALGVRPVAASVMPAAGSAVRPPAAIQTRGVVATRPPHDFRPALRTEGLASTQGTEAAPTPRLVPAPKRARGPEGAAVAPAPQGGAPGVAPGVRGPGPITPRRGGTAERPSPPSPPGSPRAAIPQPREGARPESTVRPVPPAQENRPATGAERRSRQTPPPPPAHPAPQQVAPPSQPSAPGPPARSGPSSRAREDTTRTAPPPPAHPAPQQAAPLRPAIPQGPPAQPPEPRANRSMPSSPAAPRTVTPPAPVERPAPGPPARTERPTRVQPAPQTEKPEAPPGPRSELGQRIQRVERPIREFQAEPAARPAPRVEPRAPRAKPPQASAHAAPSPAPVRPYPHGRV